MRHAAFLGLWTATACYAGSGDSDGALGAESSGAAEAAGESSGAADPGVGSTGAESGDPALPDAASSTGGATDAGAPSTDAGEASATDEGDGSSGEPAVGCDAVPDALLCEDFEADLDPTRWNVEESNGAGVAVDDGLLHITMGAVDGAHGFIQLLPGEVFPVAGNHFFGRVRMMIEAAVPDGHCYVVAASGQLDGAVARYRLDVNGGTLNSRYTHTPTVAQHGGWRKMGRDAEPAVWTCVEWEYDGSTHSMRYWFDGELDVDMEVDGAVEDPPWVAPTFNEFEIGYHQYQGANNGDAFDIWMDDLVLATERVGC